MTASSAAVAPRLSPGSPSTFVQAMPRFEPRPLDPARLRPRRTAFSFPSSISKHWLAGSPVQSHFFNAINLFVVSFEDFMARVMRARLPNLEEPDFARQIRGFMGQESTHSFVHAKYLQNLKAQGYQIEGYLNASEHIFSQWFERRLGSRISVATIAGFEHLTALLGEIILSSRMLESAEPVMKEMWEWHAAEEIEHKALAFELLKATSGSFLLRMLGALLGALVVAGFIGVGMVMLLRQDGVLWSKRTWRDLKTLLFGPTRMAVRAVSIFLEYFRPGFHPNQRDTYALAEEVFRQQATK
ncbi:metal-dependent hydrolase [Hyalangium rubrum]|uniref:Metal-dependent hydrolase n=1 Tax=Hyalangium rubrum TaxID=3103134 RepID=A0ABU5GVZ9_9BACT|nr:metal-dependent hydrolase [Hyalangium sp. s54d21]MDY7225266.1 metal-dependent hydrolase [Hyalangium sp. s54d21]